MLAWCLSSVSEELLEVADSRTCPTLFALWGSLPGSLRVAGWALQGGSEPYEEHTSSRGGGKIKESCSSRENGSLRALNLSLDQVFVNDDGVS